MRKRFVFIWACFVFILVSNGVVSPSSQAAGTIFSDIPSSHWAQSAIYQMSDKGAVSGYPDGTFRPDEVITADQFITMMIMAHTDIYPNGERDWQMSWWNGLDHGTQSLLFNLGFDFHSSKKGYWAQPFINQAVSMGFLKLNDGVFNGNFKALLTRENAAYLLEAWLNFFETTESHGYLLLAKAGVIDYFSASKYLRFSPLTVQIKGVMRGYPDRTFRPNRYVTRAEAIKMVQSLSDRKLRNPFKPDLTGTFHTELTWKDGSQRIVVFQTKEFLNATKVIEAAGNQTKGASRGNKMHFSFYMNKKSMDDYLNKEESSLEYVGTPLEMGFGIGDLDDTYELGLHINESFLTTHKEAYEAFIQFLFEEKASAFTDKITAHARKYKASYPSKVDREDFLMNGRTVSMSPLLGTERITVFISEKS